MLDDTVHHAVYAAMVESPHRFLSTQPASLREALLHSVQLAPPQVATAAHRHQNNFQGQLCIVVLASDQAGSSSLICSSTRVRTAVPSCGCATSKSSRDATAVGAFSNQDGRRGISTSDCCSQPAAVNGRDDTRLSWPDLRLGPTPAMDIVISVFVELSVICTRRLRADPILDRVVLPLLALLAFMLVPVGIAAAGEISTVLAGKMEAVGPRRI